MPRRRASLPVCSTSSRILRHGPFGGLGRRRRARVGGQVDQRPVRLVADGGDERDGAGRGRAHHHLLVEAPQVFQAAAAARDDQHVGPRDAPARLHRVEAADGCGDLGGAGLALHPHRPDQHAGREALVEAVQHVADHGAGRRRDDADHARQMRQALLALLVEQAFGGELLLALLEQRHQRADAGRLQRIDDDLVGGFAGIGRDAPDGDHLHPFGRLELQVAEGAAPDHGVDLGLVVLQREVAVAGRMHAAEARDLAAQAHVAERALQRPLDGGRQLGHREFRRIVARAAGLAGGAGGFGHGFPRLCSTIVR